MTDFQINIAVAPSAARKVWKNEKWTWTKLTKKLITAHKTHETHAEYLAMNKAEQSAIKDVGGFVGGYLKNGRRKPENVVSRQLICLDIDFASLDFWADFCMQYSCAAVLHSTHKHSIESPRYRLVIPLSREVDSDEYGAVSRKIAGNIGIELFDPTTFQVNRLMYWPSVSMDGEFESAVQEGELLEVESILASYSNWRDISEWPFNEKQKAEGKIGTKKIDQEDPNDKKGIVGSFCRTYSISEAISTFLEDSYTPSDIEDRYTYSKGSTAAGLIVYDDKFAFSHHGSDPCSEKLCNSFDLVRLHKFGHLDRGEGRPGKDSKSYRAMETWALDLTEIKSTVVQERLTKAKYDFETDFVEEESADETWKETLDIDAKGTITNSAYNISTILSNDLNLADKIKHNTFDNRRYVVESLPWRKIEDFEPVKDVDYSGIRNYIESVYGIVSSAKIDDAIALEVNRLSFNPVKDYLEALEWDEVERIDTLLIDYFGAEDNLFTREAMRKTLAAAVTRIYKPGTKFDLVLTLVGEQGTKKSTFAKKLGKQWFSDTFTTVQGKEAFEQIQGAWIIEIGELAGLKKAEVETIKHFISKCDDTYRPAYGRTVETYKRQCVFIGTTNNHTFLKDPTGNRRFMPIDVVTYRIKKDVFSEEFDDAIDQIWAEAVELYRNGEKLFLSAEADALGNKQRMSHSDTDDRKGIIEQYLEMLLPKNWDDMLLEDRRRYIQNPELRAKGVHQRLQVCVAEIWCECLEKEKEDMSRYNTRDLNDIMRSMEDWTMQKSTKRFPIYGTQKYYIYSL